MKHKRLRNKIANDVIEKTTYMGCCPNVLDTIVDIIKDDIRNTENHCNTDCWNHKCEAYMYNTKKS